MYHVALMSLATVSSHIRSASVVISGPKPPVKNEASCRPMYRFRVE